MEVLSDSYLHHFDQYGCKFYRSSKSEIEGLDEQDIRWLTQVGLPDGAIPFFFFDLYIGFLRDEDLPDCKLVLGTAFEPASRHYIILDNASHVSLIMSNGHTLFVNSSIRQLCACIYWYSRWLEDQEMKFSANPQHQVDDQEMFDLYYHLREIDRLAFEAEASIWPQLVNSEVNFLSDVVET